jgi:diamine N-acetyltransferase
MGAEEAWYERASVVADRALFTVYARDDGRPIGRADLASIDYRHRTASIGLFIGEADRRGKGCGTEIVRLLLDYAFTALGLHNVMLTAYEYNLAGLRAYRKAGFTECGRRRQCHRMGGRLWDEVYLDCLASEFVSPVLGEVFVPDEPRD